MPFLPLGWLENRYYPNATFKPEEGNPPETTVAENTLGIGGALPAWVANRDMLLLGDDNILGSH